MLILQTAYDYGGCVTDKQQVSGTKSSVSPDTLSNTPDI